MAADSQRNDEFRCLQLRWLKKALFNWDEDTI